MAFVERVPLRRTGGTSLFHLASVELERDLGRFLREQQKERRFFFFVSISAILPKFSMHLDFLSTTILTTDFKGRESVRQIVEIKDLEPI